MNHQRKDCKKPGEFGWEIWEGQDRVLYGSKGNIPGIQIGDKNAEDMTSALETFWRGTCCNVLLSDGRCLIVPEGVLEELAIKYEAK